MRYYLSIIVNCLFILSTGAALMVSLVGYDEATETHAVNPDATAIWLIVSVTGLGLALSWMLVELFRRYRCECPRGTVCAPQ